MQDKEPWDYLKTVGVIPGPRFLTWVPHTRPSASIKSPTIQQNINLSFFIIENTSHSQGVQEMSADALTALSLIPSIGNETFGHFTATSGTTIYEIQFVIKTMAQLINSLHSLGLCHGELSMKHVLVTSNNEVSNKYKCLH